MQQDNPLDDLKGKASITPERLDILDASKDKPSINTGKPLSDLLSNIPNKADNTPDKEYEWPIRDSKADQDRKNWEQLKKPQPWHEEEIDDKTKEMFSTFPVPDVLDLGGKALASYMKKSNIEEITNKRKQYMSEYPITPQEAVERIKSITDEENHPAWYNNKEYIPVRLVKPISHQVIEGYGYIDRKELERIVTEILEQ